MLQVAIFLLVKDVSCLPVDQNESDVHESKSKDEKATQISTEKIKSSVNEIIENHETDNNFGLNANVENNGIDENQLIKSKDSANPETTNQDNNTPEKMLSKENLDVDNKDFLRFKKETEHSNDNQNEGNEEIVLSSDEKHTGVIF